MVHGINRVADDASRLGDQIIQVELLQDVIFDHPRLRALKELSTQEVLVGLERDLTGLPVKRHDARFGIEGEQGRD